ncbi:hypothetical protein INR49_010080, partial [Caranx melampygus]
TLIACHLETSKQKFRPPSQNKLSSPPTHTHTDTQTHSLITTIQISFTVEMKTAPHEASVTLNLAVCASAEELNDNDEADYVNSAACAVNYTPAAAPSDPPDTRAQSMVRSLSAVAVCWAVLLLITVPRIHFTSVLSTKLSNEMDLSANAKHNLKLQVDQLKQTQATMKENIEKLETKNQQLRDENRQVKTENQHLKTEKQRLNETNHRLNEETQHLKTEKQHLNKTNQRLNEENQHLKTQNQRLKEIHTTPTWETTEDWGRTAHSQLTTSFPPPPWPWMMTDWTTPSLNVSEHQMSPTNYSTDFYHRRWRRGLPCPKGWTHFLSSCYAIDRQSPRSWDDARDKCRGQNAHLVVIETAEEQDFIYNSTVADLGSDRLWIGLRVELGSWRWISGSNLTQEFWTVAPGRGQHCATSVTRGWRAVSCTDKHGWICEKKAD